MSATNRGSARSESDFYATPISTINKFLDSYQIKQGNVLEPCAGNGNIVRTLRERESNWITALELRQEEYQNLKSISNKAIIHNFLTWQPDMKYKTIITNPPYSIAQEFIEKCFEIANQETEIIMLLRLAFLESKKRYEFWQKHPVNELYILSERPSFTGKGTDATAYAWFVWNGSDKQKIKVI